MANANSTLSRTPKRNAGPAEELAEKLIFHKSPTRFNAERMARHGLMLGRSGELLSTAYATAGAVGAMARIVRASQIARQCGTDCLTQSDEDHILHAVEILAEQLSDSLCYAADEFDDELTKGGA